MPMRTEIIPDTLAGAERTPAALHPLPCLPAPRRTSVQGSRPSSFSSKLFLRQAGLCLFKGDSTHTWSVAAGNARPEGARRVRHRGHCHHVQGCAPLSWRIGPPRNRRRLHVLPKHRRNMCCRQSHRTQLDRRLKARSWGASTPMKMCIQADLDTTGALRHMNKNNSARPVCRTRTSPPLPTFFVSPKSGTVSTPEREGRAQHGDGKL